MRSRLGESVETISKEERVKVVEYSAEKYVPLVLVSSGQVLSISQEHSALLQGIAPRRQDRTSS